MPTSLSPTFSQVTSAQRRTLIAAALGWMLDAFDAMLYALVVAHIMRDLGMSKSTAGLLNSLTLLASGIGGVAFGFIADRRGAQARSDAEHSHLLGLFVRIRALNLGSHAGGIPFHPGAGHGRRVEYGSNLGGGNLAD